VESADHLNFRSGSESRIHPPLLLTSLTQIQCLSTYTETVYSAASNLMSGNHLDFIRRQEIKDNSVKL